MKKAERACRPASSVRTRERLVQLPNELANQPADLSIRRFFFRLRARRIRIAGRLRRRTAVASAATLSITVAGAARGAHRIAELLLLLGREHLFQPGERILGNHSV